MGIDRKNRNRVSVVGRAPVGMGTALGAFACDGNGLEPQILRNVVDRDVKTWVVGQVVNVEAVSQRKPAP